MRIVFFSIILLLGFVFNVSAQEVIISGKTGERLLEWKDFNGTADENSNHAAYTYWGIRYGFSGVDFPGGKVSFKGLEITLSFESDKSWVKEGKASDYLLKHEQGHFDIGRLCQLEIMATIKTTNFDEKDFKLQMKEIFKNARQKYHDLGIKYDEETKHSINKEKQEEWNKFLLAEKERLLKLNQ